MCDCLECSKDNLIIKKLCLKKNKISIKKYFRENFPSSFFTRKLYAALKFFLDITFNSKQLATRACPSKKGNALTPRPASRDSIVIRCIVSDIIPIFYVTLVSVAIKT